MNFLGLITRCKDEFFIKEFCDYYLSQGVDRIYVIDDNSKDKSIYSNIKDKRVTIFWEKDLFKGGSQMTKVNKYYKKLKKNFKWMISVDVDEFITTKKNKERTIREELATTFKNVDCIKIPWVMMSCNKRQKNPKSILLENTYRWNHNKKHPHKIKKFRCRYKVIEVKCIFKTSSFNQINVHCPSAQTKNKNIIVDSIRKRRQPLNSSYRNLREHNIKNGYLLCYHYRIISTENCKNKLEKSQYLRFSLNNLLKSDHPEIKDETLKNKVKKYHKNDTIDNNLVTTDNPKII